MRPESPTLDRLHRSVVTVGGYGAYAVQKASWYGRDILPYWVQYWVEDPDTGRLLHDSGVMPIDRAGDASRAADEAARSFACIALLLNNDA